MPYDSRCILRFIQLLPNIPVTGDYMLRDLPGSGKRIDVLCRDLAACFEWGPTNIDRSQIELLAIFSNQVILTFRNPSESMPQGERGWAEVIKSALQGDPEKYINVDSGDLESIICKFNRSSKSCLWVLHEEGTPFGELKIQTSETQNSFMLGDYRGFDSQTEELISKHNLIRISLGQKSYLSSHCVGLIISKFEKMVT